MIPLDAEGIPLFFLTDGRTRRSVYDQDGIVRGQIVYGKVGQVLGWFPSWITRYAGEQVIPMPAERAARVVMDYVG